MISYWRPHCAVLPSKKGSTEVSASMKTVPGIGIHADNAFESPGLLIQCSSGSQKSPHGCRIDGQSVMRASRSCRKTHQKHDSTLPLLRYATQHSSRVRCPRPLPLWLIDTSRSFRHNSSGLGYANSLAARFNRMCLLQMDMYHCVYIFPICPSIMCVSSSMAIDNHK